MKLLAAGLLGALIVYEAISWNLSEDPDWEAFIKASPARMARRRKRPLPPKDKRPKKITPMMQYDPNFWSRRYYDVGDRIKGRGMWMGRSTPFNGKITKIVQNRYGRVSYYIGERMVLAEEIE